MTDKSKLRQIRENIPKVYDSGWDVGYETGNAEGFSEGYSQGYRNGTADATPKGEVELTENNKTYDVTSYASAKVNVAGIEDLSTALTEQEELVAELKGIIAQKAKLGDAKLPSIIERTVTEITAEDLAGVTVIGKNAFLEMTSLESIELPEGLTKIGYRAFEDCYNIASPIVIPSSVTEIEMYGFSGCSKIPSVTLNEGLKTLGQEAFKDCKLLSEITFPSSITSLNTTTFMGCDLREFVCPPRVAGLQTNLLYGNKNLTKVILHDRVSSLGQGVFYSCSSLPNLKLPKGVSQIQNNLFNGCTSFEYLDMTNYGRYGVFPTLSSTNAFTNCGTKTTAGTFEIRVPMGRKALLTAMTNWATYTDKIVEVDAPMEDAFDLTATEGLEYALSSGKNYYICNGVGTSDSKDIVIAALIDDVPVAEIKSQAFYSKGLTSVVLPPSIKTIGTYAFRKCDFASITLPDSVRSIESSAFQQCSKLENIVIPNMVSDIPNYAFDECHRLEYIDLTSYGAYTPLPTLSNTYAFRDCGRYSAKGTFEIRVPKGRGAELSAMTNWSTYADNIVEV